MADEVKTLKIRAQTWRPMFSILVLALGLYYRFWVPYLIDHILYKDIYKQANDCLDIYCIWSFIRLSVIFICSFIHSFIHSFVSSFIYLFIYSFIYLLSECDDELKPYQVAKREQEIYSSCCYSNSPWQPVPRNPLAPYRDVAYGQGDEKSVFP